MLSANEGWAAGSEGLMHYHDGKWWTADNYLTQEGMAGLFREEHDMADLAMVSPTEGWAVGRNGQDGLILHYHDGCWQKVDWNQRPGNYYKYGLTLYAIQMLSPDNGWIVGSGAILHYQNGKWSQVDAPDADKVTLEGISMISSDEGWAVGGFSSILHYKDGRWAKVDWVSPSASELPRSVNGFRPFVEDIQMVSPNEGWAVGEAGLIVHYKAGKWNRVVVDGKYDLRTIQMLSSTEGWASGGDGNDTGGVILHYKDGKWSEQFHQKDAFFFSVYMTSPSDGWTATDYWNFMHYQNGQWQLHKQKFKGESLLHQGSHFTIRWLKPHNHLLPVT